MKIKKNDTVMIIAGKDKGKEGKVIATDSQNLKIKVIGCKMQTKFTKKSIHGPGSQTKKEGWIDVSNVAVKDTKSGKPSRIGYTRDKNGKKVRVLKKSNEVIS